MSIMMANVGTTAKIAEMIYRVMKFGYEQERFTFSYESANYIKSIWGDIDEEREQCIYEALRALNRNSYNTRYKQSDVPPFIDSPYKYQCFKRSEEFYKGENGAEDIQKIKNVQFFYYQCDEHDNNPEAVKMFKVMEEIEYHLIRGVISNMPEWKAAKWE